MALLSYRKSGGLDQLLQLLRLENPVRGSDWLYFEDAEVVEQSWT